FSVVRIYDFAYDKLEDCVDETSKDNANFDLTTNIMHYEWNLLNNNIYQKPS
ncbi:hypothetical protein JL09_g6643, partial [Pichia kudriavzevii]